MKEKYEEVKNISCELDRSDESGEFFWLCRLSILDFSDYVAVDEVFLENMEHQTRSTHDSLKIIINEKDTVTCSIEKMTDEDDESRKRFHCKKRITIDDFKRQFGGT